MTTLLRELIDELPELFGPSDRSKEIGIAAIFLYYHSIVALAERNSKFATLPPVLISTLSVLAGLGLLHGALGAEATADIVSYFDPSVQFLGNYMSLWLVPPLVLLPKAVRKIPDAGSIVWIKLVFVHFSLWALSVSGGTLLVKLLKANGNYNANSRSNHDSLNPRNSLTQIWRMMFPAGGPRHSAVASEAESQTVTAPLTPVRSAEPESPNRTSNDKILSLDDVIYNGATSPFPRRQMMNKSHENGSSSPSRVTASILNEYPPTYLRSAVTSIPSDAEVAARILREKQIKLIRFWFTVSASCYAATTVIKTMPARFPMYRGLLSEYTPALLSTAIAVFTAGQALPHNIKKLIHPLMLTALSSGAAVLVISRIQKDPAIQGWDALYMFTSQSRSGLALFERLRAGDMLSLLLGPSCTALAFRIYSTLQKIDSRSLVVSLSTSFFTALSSLLISPLAGSVVGLPIELNNMLAHRTVTSALAIPAAQVTGASPELTTASVLITGLYGASGSWLYDILGMPGDEVAGSVIGSTSHTIGTSELVRSQPSAAGIAGIAMMTTGLCHAALCSLPPVSQCVRRFAGAQSE